MSKKAKDFLNSKMQVELPEKLSKDNILDSIDSSKAEIIEMPKKKSVAKKLVPMVASLFLVIGIVGIYMSSQQKEVPVSNGSTEVMQYQTYDKIYEKFDTLHKEYKKNNFLDNFFYVDEEEFYIEDGVAMDIREGIRSLASGSQARSFAPLPAALPTAFVLPSSSRGSKPMRQADAGSIKVPKAPARKTSLISSGSISRCSVISWMPAAMAPLASCSCRISSWVRAT